MGAGKSVQQRKGLRVRRIEVDYDMVAFYVSC